MRRVNLETLEIEEVEQKKQPQQNESKQYVYVLLEEGTWDYEDTEDIDVYHNFETAVNEFNARVTKSKYDMRRWLEKDSIEEETLAVDSEYEYAVYSAYEADNYARIHNRIVIKKKEVL